MSEEKLRGIFWGGLAGGLGSIIPLLSFLNCFCCLWAWLAGGLAVALTGKGKERTASEAPVVGALAGAFAGLVSSTLQLLYAVTIGPSLSGTISSLRGILPGSIPEESLRMLEGLPESGLALLVMHVISAILVMGIFAVFGALGGLIYDRLSRPPASRGTTPPPPKESSHEAPEQE